jgi:hypothetical protein
VEIVLKQKTRTQLILHLKNQFVYVLSLALNSAIYLIFAYAAVHTIHNRLSSHHGQTSAVWNTVDNGL